MKKRMENESLATELYDSRDRPGEWEEEPVEITVKPRRSEVVSFRIPSTELDELEVAAEEAGESISEFVRRALALRMGHVVSEPLFDVWATPASFVFNVDRVLGACNRTDVEDLLVPDFPPLLASMTEGQGPH